MLLKSQETGLTINESTMMLIIYWKRAMKSLNIKIN